MSDERDELLEIQFRLLELQGDWNEFSAKKVAGDLREYKSLYHAFMMIRDSSLISLRDMPQGIWSVDTLYILAKPEAQEKLEEIAGGWKADTVVWLSKEEACRSLGSYTPEPQKVLRVWWD